MMHELRWPGYDSLEFGLDVRSLEFDPTDLATFAIVRRPDVMNQLAAWDLGRALGDATRNGVRTSSALAVVTVDDSTPASYVAGGQAVERLWLEATRLGLAVQPVSPTFIFALNSWDYSGLVGQEKVPELSALSAQFRAAIGLEETEQLCIVARVLRAPPPSVASRRYPLERVFTRHSGRK
jgi:hypothetical protein